MPATQTTPQFTFKKVLYTSTAIFLSALILSCGAFAVRLAQGPVDGAKAIPLIESALSGSTGLNFDITDMQIFWKSGKSPLGLDISGITVSGEHGVFLSLNKLEATLSPLSLLIGKMDIANARIHDIRLRITRLDDGKITLTGSDTQSHTATTSALTLQDLATRLPEIDELLLQNASIILEDKKDAIVRHFHKVNLSMVQDGSGKNRAITGYLTAPLADAEQHGKMAIDFIYNASEQTLNAAANITEADTRTIFGRTLWRAGLPMIDMQFDARANIVLDNNFLLQDISLNVKSDGGTLSWPRRFNEQMPIQTLTRFVLDLGYNPTSHTLELRTAEITFKGLTLKASGDLKTDEQWHNLTGALNWNIPVLAVDLLPEIWPKAWDSGAREWLVDKMQKGRFANINVKVPLSAKLSETHEDDSRNWDITTGEIKSDFTFTGVSVDYNAPMLPATNVTGNGVFDNGTLTLNVTSANSGELKVDKGHLYFTNLIKPEQGEAELNFDISGSVSAVFQYLEPEPISYRQKVGLNLAGTTGSANIKAKVNFPTTEHLEIDDVKVDVNATLHNLHTPPILKDLSLSGQSFTLNASPNHFILEGEGSLGQSPIKISWEEIFTPQKGAPYASKIDIDILTGNDLRQKFIGGLAGRITGDVPAKISITTPPKGNSKLKGEITLTPARVDLINPFNTVKQRGINSVLNFDATLEKGTLKSIDNAVLSGASLSLESGKINFALDNKNNPIPQSATLKNLKLGETNANINASWKGEHVISADIEGEAFDARYILGHSEYKTEAQNALSYHLNLNLERLFITERPLHKVSALFVGDTKGTYKQADMKAQTKNGYITLNYDATGTPNDRIFLEMTNAGEGLYALGINKRVRGGYLRAEGTPLKGGKNGDMHGFLRLEDFSIRQAPTLVKLVNLLSLPGIVNLLAQDTGLSFKNAEANVTLLNRNGGATLLIRDGRTSGASLGLTFEGEVNQANGTLALQGTVVPMSGINTAIASIPLIGDILTGGKLGGGVFAATYTMKGSSADPDVSINPLSVLTPGILRRILFEGKLGETKEADTPASPPTFN